MSWELSDAITETAHRVIANVFDGDLGPIRDLVTDPNAEEYARASTFDAVGALFVQGKIAREALVGFLRDCRSSLDVPPGSPLWTAWASIITDLRLAELRESAERAFAEELIAPMDMGVDSLRDGFQRGGEPAENPRFLSFGDVAEELAGWSSFAASDERSDDLLGAGDDEATDEDLLKWAAEDSPAERPAVNLLRHVGRNDPCPCGSGKKFKKCCGG